MKRKREVESECECCKKRAIVEEFMGQRMCERCALYWKGFYGHIIIEDCDGDEY